MGIGYIAKNEWPGSLVNVAAVNPDFLSLLTQEGAASREVKICCLENGVL